MTRKDYVLIAEALRLANGSIRVAPYDAETAIELVAEIIANKLENENPRFDRQRFLIASGAYENFRTETLEALNN